MKEKVWYSDIKKRLSVLITCLFMCTVIACIASAATTTKSVSGYAGKNYVLNIYGDTWYQTGSEYNTDTCLSTNEVVATPAMNRNTSSTIYKYVHSAEALNYQNHSIVEDKLTYRVDQAN